MYIYPSSYLILVGLKLTLLSDFVSATVKGCFLSWTTEELAESQC